MEVFEAIRGVESQYERVKPGRRPHFFGYIRKHCSNEQVVLLHRSTEKTTNSAKHSSPGQHSH